MQTDLALGAPGVEVFLPDLSGFPPPFALRAVVFRTIRSRALDAELSLLFPVLSDRVDSTSLSKSWKRVFFSLVFPAPLGFLDSRFRFLEALFFSTLERDAPDANDPESEAVPFSLFFLSADFLGSLPRVVDR